MPNYIFSISYDGTRYEGWQRQVRTGETIQGKLEKALAEITGEKVNVIGAGRTDAGVHALAQRANVHLTKAFPTANLEEALNRSLPDDIGVSDMETVDDRFHARFSAKGKWYRYRIRVGAKKDVFTRRYVWQLGEALDVSAMREAASLLTGTHDFTSFCGNKHFKKSAVRTLSSLTLTEKDGELLLDFKGDGFLQNMIRIAVGTLVEIGEGKRNAADIPAILAAKNRSQAGFTAPPQGLMLMKVAY